MEQRTVRRLEKELEDSVAEVIGRLGLRHLPLLPSRRTMHAMAKAAVAVYEAVTDDQASSQE